MVKILKLTLNKKPFDVMKTGEKKNEFREPSKWIESRLFNKDGTKRYYDFIEFSHGYAKKRNDFSCEFKGFKKTLIEKSYSYSNSLEITVPKGYYNIFCGDIIFGETKNPKEADINTITFSEIEDIQMLVTVKGKSHFLIEKPDMQSQAKVDMETALRLALDSHIIMDPSIDELREKLKEIPK